jgi:diguanylate cyclase (GGDEF)-like protein
MDPMIDRVRRSLAARIGLVLGLLVLLIVIVGGTGLVLLAVDAGSAGLIAFGGAVALGFALGVLLALLGGRAVYRSVSRPVADMRRAANRLGSEDLTARTSAEGGDELGRLGGDFNRMAERLERATMALTHLALHDPLTELPNRAVFLDRCRHAVERLRRHGGVSALMIVDVDGFTAVNETHGYAFGDRLLIQLGERLRTSLRMADSVARLGGDEFAVLLEGLGDHGDAYLAARRILRAVSEPFRIDENEVVLGASVGVAFTVDGDEDQQSLLRDAQLACRAAKRAGGGRFEAFRPELYDEVAESANLEVDLGQAIENGELAVVYQPIVALDTGAVRGLEAFVRWIHPQRGVISPAEFLPLAESNGVIEALGREVLRVACADLAQARRAAGYHLNVAVNLTARQFRSPLLQSDVRQALRESDLQGSALVLEITESALVDDPEFAEAQMRELKALGVRIALDDFGTGDSSLSFIARFPIDVLKIDSSFISGSGDEGLAQARLTETIISLARTLDLTSIAEGVETFEQARQLSAMGCNLVQGYVFARPLRRDAVVALLGDRLSTAFRRRQLAA